MKKYFYLIISVLLLSACSKKANDEIKPVNVKPTIKDAGAIAFKAAPLSDHELKLYFPNVVGTNLFKAILKQDNAVLATAPVTDDGSGTVSAAFNYDFKPGVKYNFLVQTDLASNGITQYSIADYTHSYVSAYNYQKIFSSHISMGPNGFDISPSRNYLFIADDESNDMKLKRISLKTLAVEDLPYHAAGLIVRAVSDNELLVYGDNTTENLPAAPVAGTYDAILARYNIDTKKMTFVNYFSSNYGRISRIVNNHVLVADPSYYDNTASLINLDNLSKVKYSLNDFNYAAVDQLSFNHIICDNMLLNTTTGKLTQPLTLSANSGLVEIDDATGYGFVQSYVLTPNVATSSFSVYKNKTAVYTSPQTLGLSVFFPVIYNIQNDVLTYFQSFNYDTKVNIDGYYTLNIKTGETKLVQADSNPNSYIISDYQLKDGSVFSVRADGVYKLTHK